MKKGDVIYFTILEDEERKLTDGESGLWLPKNGRVILFYAVQDNGGLSQEYQPCSSEIVPAEEWLTKEQIETLTKQRDALMEKLEAMLEHTEAPPNSGCSGYIWISKAVLEDARALLKTIKEGGTP